MTDRELLVRAANAAEIECDWSQSSQTMIVQSFHRVIPWNPLTDDGDALRLAVKLGIVFEIFGDFVRVEWKPHHVVLEDFTTDPYAATRRAIVKAAAEMSLSVS